MKVLHEPAIEEDNISGEATNKIQGLHVSGLFSSVEDQNGELFVACILKLHSSSSLFGPLSDFNALETCYMYHFDPLAYNYIATLKKKLKSSFLSIGILKPRCHSLSSEILQPNSFL